MEDLLVKEPVKRVREFIKKFDNKLDVIVLNTTARTANNAANALNCKVGAIVKTLLFKNEESNEYYLCLISGDKAESSW